jgi:23S rRNA (pseudouridine1915-N3)-methyltransferase
LQLILASISPRKNKPKSGPAELLTQEYVARAHKKISFGAMTLPHELARTVLAEQIYRALTILAGHPYHSGH